jgi:benzylsuccinate CoA-transferase BbsF subunit
MAAAKPLAGVRVLDFTWAWAGPHCARMMADMGAEVLRVESDQRTDHLRANGPWPGGERGGLNRSGNFNQLNRNKDSLRINLKHPRGVALALDLAAVSDVVLSNFAPGVIERLGLGYEAVKARNPGVIWAAISGFGRTGPQKGHVTFGPPMTFYSGLGAITGYGPGDSPRLLGSTYCDSVAGGHAYVAVLVALRHKRRTGEGQAIDLSMLEATLDFLPEMVLDYTVAGEVRQPRGNTDDVYSPQDTYRCAGEDEWVALTVRTEPQWQALCALLGRPDLACLSDAVARRARAAEVDAAIGAWTAGRSMVAAFHELQAAGVPAAPCYPAQGMVEDPHLNARGFWVAPPHAETGPLTLAGLAWTLSETPGAVERGAPLFGEHTRPALRRVLGLTDAELDELDAAGVLQ